MVMVSHGRKFIFLKTRKTAGTSCEMLLEPWCAPPGRVVVEETDELVSEFGIVGARMKRANYTWKNHMPARRVSEELGSEVFDSYFKLTSVRNPFRRAISFFYWIMALKNEHPPSDIDVQKARFRDFIFSRRFEADKGVTHIGGEYVVDDAIRLENLHEDLSRIGQRLGIMLDAAKMPHTKDTSNYRPPVDLREFFSTEIERKIRRKQAWVFEHFDYPQSADAAFRKPPAAPDAVVVIGSEGASVALQA